MPRKRRQVKVRAQNWDTAACQRILTHGYWWFAEAPFGDPIDFDLVREAWDEIGPVLLVDWVGTSPGSRPWAWWRLDAPEPRRADENQAAYLDRHPDLWWTGERERWRTDAERAADAAKTRQLAGANGEDQGETRTAAGCDRRTRGIGE